MTSKLIYLHKLWKDGDFRNIGWHTIFFALCDRCYVACGAFVRMSLEGIPISYH